MSCHIDTPKASPDTLTVGSSDLAVADSQLAALTADIDSISSFRIQAYRLSPVHVDRMGIRVLTVRQDGELRYYDHWISYGLKIYSLVKPGLHVKEVPHDGAAFRAEDVRAIVEYQFGSGKDEDRKRTALRQVFENFRPSLFGHERLLFNYVDHICSFAAQLDVTFKLDKDGKRLKDWLEETYAEDHELWLTKCVKDINDAKRIVVLLSELAIRSVSPLSSLVTITSHLCKLKKLWRS